jgi:AbrB family looped-hinge helix DNA binding protein
MEISLKLLTEKVKWALSNKKRAVPKRSSPFFSTDKKLPYVYSVKSIVGMKSMIYPTDRRCMIMINHGKFFGTTSMGERGQVVIPSDARDELDIKSGEKFVVFGDARKGTVILVKSEIMNKFANLFFNTSKRFEKIAKEILDKTEPEAEEDDTN